ncbi:hypothetical protein ACLBXM_17900 [Xanthobacteraceae bacterium A53D]
MAGDEDAKSNAADGATAPLSDDNLEGVAGGLTMTVGGLGSIEVYAIKQKELPHGVVDSWQALNPVSTNTKPLNLGKPR